MRIPWIIGTLAIVLPAAACNRSGDTSPHGVTNSTVISDAGPTAGGDGAGPPMPGDSGPAPNRNQPTIKLANWEETQQLVARNPGRVVILDLWASW